MISIHVLRVEDDTQAETDEVRADMISIHVLRVEDDAKQLQPAAHGDAISIHVLRVEDDLCGFPDIGVVVHEFQSTSSVWRTTMIYL